MHNSFILHVYILGATKRTRHIVYSAHCILTKTERKNKCSISYQNAYVINLTGLAEPLSVGAIWSLALVCPAVCGESMAAACLWLIAPFFAGAPLGAARLE